MYSTCAGRNVSGRPAQGMLFWGGDVILLYIVHCMCSFSVLSLRMCDGMCVWADSVCNCQNNDSSTKFRVARAMNYVNNYDKSRLQLCLTVVMHQLTNIEPSTLTLPLLEAAVLIVLLWNRRRGVCNSQSYLVASTLYSSTLICSFLKANVKTYFKTVASKYTWLHTDSILYKQKVCEALAQLLYNSLFGDTKHNANTLYNCLIIFLLTFVKKNSSLNLWNAERRHWLPNHILRLSIISMETELAQKLRINLLCFLAGWTRLHLTLCSLWLLHLTYHQ